MNVKEIVTGIIAIIVIVASVVSLFLSVNEIGARILQSVSTLVIGYYFGVKTYPLASILKKKSE